jgi:hypothetical protein
MIIGFIFMQLFNILMGYIEGAYWHFRNIVVLSNHFKTPYALKLNLHSALFALKVLFAIIILYSCRSESILSLILFSVALIISQPYFHLGVMYWHRNKLDSRVYKKGFFDVNVIEKGDSSKLDLMLKKQISYQMRLFGFIISIILIIFA